MTNVNLTKDFNTVNRDGLQKIMAKFGCTCPPNFIAEGLQLHDGILARVQNDGELSEPFLVTNVRSIFKTGLGIFMRLHRNIKHHQTTCR